MKLWASIWTTVSAAFVKCWGQDRGEIRPKWANFESDQSWKSQDFRLVFLYLSLYFFVLIFVFFISFVFFCKHLCDVSNEGIGWLKDNSKRRDTEIFKTYFLERNVNF